MSTYCIIPARSGSKRIADKNIKPFLGTPMLELTIKKARNSGIFDQIIVSTDSLEYSRLAEKSGALVPFIRNADLSNDFATTVQVIADSLSKIEIKSHEAVCCLYPVTPLLNMNLVSEGLNLLLRNQTSNYVFAAQAYDYPIQRALERDLSGRFNFIDATNIATRTQDLKKTFHDAGQFYWGFAETWRREAPLLTDSLAVEISNWLSVDVDTPEDWRRAELLYKVINEND